MTLVYNNYVRRQNSERIYLLNSTVLSGSFGSRRLLEAIADHIFLTRAKSKDGETIHFFACRSKEMSIGFFVGASVYFCELFSPVSRRGIRSGNLSPTYSVVQSFHVISGHATAREYSLRPLKSATTCRHVRRNCSFVGLFRRNSYIFVIAFVSP